MLVLVRHAMPAYEESVRPQLWPLSAQGQRAARELALPAGAYLVASDEVKAWQTLEEAGAGATVVRDARFNEVRRVGEPWDGRYKKVRREYVGGVDHPGWEPRREVVERFDAGVRAYLAMAGPRPLVVGTHGMAMTIWLTATVDLPEPVAFWESLGLPDARPVPR